MASKGKVILIDGNSLLYRAFFAMPHFSTLEDQPTNAVYGFTMMLLKLIDEEKPDILLVAFDAPARTFRHEEYKEYKAHRKSAPDELKSQGPLVREVVDAFNVPKLEVEGFEADDVVGTVARQAESEGYDVVIVTGDLDELQLVDDKVMVMTTVKGVTETVIYDEKAVEDRYGLKPEQLVDYKALKGDPSDNIPGVPGIGDKTAAKLIQEYGDLENLLYHTEDIKQAKLQSALVQWAEQARLSKRLATIITDVPLDLDLAKCRASKPDYVRLRELFKRLEFRSLLKRLPEETAQGELFAEVREEPKKIAFNIVSDRTGLDKILEDIRKNRSMAMRMHGSTNHGVTADPLGMGVALTSGTACYVLFTDGLELDDFRDVLKSEDVAKHGYNLKYDIEIIRRAGIDIRGPMFDIMIGDYLLNPTRGTHALEEMAFHYAGIELPAINPKTGTGEFPIEQIYATQADAVRSLVPIIGSRLAADDMGDLMADMEMPLVPILAEMELAGVAVDTDWLNQLSKRLEERIGNLEKEIYQLAGVEFNIGSPKQLQTILFEKLGLPAIKKTKTGYSTDAETLAALAPAHEIVAKILEYRELTKLKSTYADSLPKLINPETGRIHTSLNQAVTSTGRLSSSEPNLQNIPIKTEIGREIRKAFIASPGNLLVSADYSQIELRILAHVSRDPELIRAYEQEEDVHTRTATKIFGVPVEEVTSDMRRQAKTVNFAVIYGMSDYGLSRELNIPPTVAKQYIESYFQEYPGVKMYAAETLARARVRGYVESLLGRRRYIPELNSPNRTFREFAERAAVNMPIQGTAADIVKLAMVRVHDRLREHGFSAKLILQVHDELVFDTPEDEVHRLLPIIKEAMEKAFEMDVPLKVETKVGKDWCTALPVSAEEREEVIT